MSDMFFRHRITDMSGLSDESKLSGRAENRIVPLDENELRGALIYLNNRSLPANIVAMRTGVCGGAVPQGGDVIELTNLTGITGVGKDDRGFYIRVRPCTTLDDIDAQLLSGLTDDTPELSDGALSEFRATGPYFYPVDPTETGSSIGGNIATNASGPLTFRYGPTRDWVRAIKIMFADGGYTWINRGAVHADGRRMSFCAGRSFYSFMVPSYDSRTGVKNAAGPLISENMDLIDLFIGSEGIFGVICEAEIYLAPRKRNLALVAFFPGDAEALAAAKGLKAGCGFLEFLEFMDGRSLELLRRVTAGDPAFLGLPAFPEGAGSSLFFDIPADSPLDGIIAILGEHGCSPSQVWCASEPSDAARLRRMRHSIPRTIFEYVASLKGEMPAIHKMGTDMSVPDAAADEMMAFYARRLEEEGLEYVMFGHIGDNHPHVEIILKSVEDFEKSKRLYDEFAAKAVELGGSPSAEHGIGKIKTHYITMLYGDRAAEELRKVKSVLDPNMILCPGNIIGGAR